MTRTGHTRIATLPRLLAAVLVAFTTACNPAPGPTDEPTEAPAAAVDAAPAAIDLAEAGAAIAAVNAETGEFIRAGKGASVATQYTADALLITPSTPAVSGTEAIARQFQAVVDSGVTDLTLSASEVESREDLAVELGRYRATNGNGAIVDEGRYVVVWRKEPSGWKRHRDFVSSDRPPVALSPAALPAATVPAAE